MAEALHRGLDFDQVMAKDPSGREIILVHLDGQVCAYENRCPHVGVGLDWGNGRCLLEDGRTLLCALHGALFEAATGHCTDGPCAGDALTKVPIRIVGDAIELAEH